MRRGSGGVPPAQRVGPPSDLGRRGHCLFCLKALRCLRAWAEDRAPWRHDPSTDPGTKTEGGRHDAASFFPFGIGTKAANRSLMIVRPLSYLTTPVSPFHAEPLHLQAEAGGGQGTAPGQRSRGGRLAACRRAVFLGTVRATRAEDRATWGRDPSAGPGAKTGGGVGRPPPWPRDWHECDKSNQIS